MEQNVGTAAVAVYSNTEDLEFTAEIEKEVNTMRKEKVVGSGSRERCLDIEGEERVLDYVMEMNSCVKYIKSKFEYLLIPAANEQTYENDLYMDKYVFKMLLNKIESCCGNIFTEYL